MIRKYFDKGKAVIKAMGSDLSQLRHFVVFIGNPRSGTTLVRSLLDAHPSIVLGNEVNALERLANGESIRTIMGRILDQSSFFARHPFWEGYSYRIPMTSVGNAGVCTVIGDKKAGRTTRLFMKDMSLVESLQKQIPIPVRFLHCVRHPYDVITTKTKKNGHSLEWNIQHYFNLEQTNADVCRLLKPKQIKRVYLEKLIENPDEVLTDLIRFLDLNTDDDYLAACRTIIYDKPNLSRFKQDWSTENKSAVEKAAANCDHLSCYLDQGRLLF